MSWAVRRNDEMIIPANATARGGADRSFCLIVGRRMTAFGDYGFGHMLKCRDDRTRFSFAIGQMNISRGVRIAEASIHDIGHANEGKSGRYHRDAKSCGCKSDERGRLLYLLHYVRRKSACAEQRRHVFINGDARLPRIGNKDLVTQVRKFDT